MKRRSVGSGAFPGGGFGLDSARGNGMKLRIIVVILVALAALGGVAAAQDESLNKARASFDEAQAFYAQGKYEEAAQSFETAYAARAFPQFLFNIGAAHEKARKYELAVDYYKKYLAAEPKAQDKDAVLARIKVLEDEIKRLAAEAAKPPPPDGTEVPPPDQGPSKAIEALGDINIRGLVVIESEPQNATIYVDDKKNGPFAKTPWSGSLEGEHTIILEKQGYKQIEKRFSPDPNRLLVFVIGLAEEDYLGWIDIKSNVPGAEIFIDDKSVGAIGKTPYSGNLKPGKHTIWITTEGYDEHTAEVNIIPGETHEINATLEGAPVGYLNFRGEGIEHSSIYLDGELLCKRGPCRKAVRRGAHKVTIKRAGHKSYTQSIELQEKTEVNMRANLVKKPGRGDAVWAYLFSAAFAGGGVYLGLTAQGLEDDLAAEIAAGNPPPDSDDPRYLRGKIFAISADAAYALAGVSFVTALYYTFRDKGPASTGAVDVRALALQPQVGPGYAGFGMEVNW